MGNLKITRTFHPIGQGGFYSERHNNFNIVYDCGVHPISNYGKTLAGSVFSKNENIDVLFLSHFDYDHISTIPMLRKSVKSISTVIIPLLTNKQKNLLININRILSHSFITLIKNPGAYFGPNTTIVYVNSDDDQKPDNEDDLVDLRDLSESREKKIEVASGTRFTLRDTPGWVFIPYNHKHEERHVDLIKRIGSFGKKYNIQRLESDPDYTIAQLTDKNTRTELKTIYEELDGNINENSMLVYSGPINNFSAKNMWMYVSTENEYFCSINYNCRVGCIYTGDSDFNKFRLKDIYPYHKKYVGTVQVPHHGSIKSFNMKGLEGFYDLICPISYGTKNSHSHPDWSIVSALSLRQFSPILITENPSSKVVQRIYFK